MVGRKGQGYRAFLFKNAVYVAVVLRKIQLQNLNTVIAFPFN